MTTSATLQLGSEALARDRAYRHRGRIIGSANVNAAQGDACQIAPHILICDESMIRTGGCIADEPEDDRVVSARPIIGAMLPI